jgi:predicted Rossmann fold flavoprotein
MKTPHPSGSALQHWDVCIIGAGAAGCFTAIQIKEQNPRLRVIILEQGARALQKVRVSGGGRCNVTHNSDDIPHLLNHYPRRHKQLKGQLMAFPPSRMRTWLNTQGVTTHSEQDGRVFPSTNTSDTIIQAFMHCLQRHHVPIHYHARIDNLQHCSTHIQVQYAQKEQKQALGITATSLVLATGSHPSGYALAEELGLTVTPRVPSLFTFQVALPTVHERAGLSLPNVQLRLESTALGKKPLEQQGPLLFTHWGLSGPAVLKLSAQAALALHESRYHGTLYVNALPDQAQDETLHILQHQKLERPNATLLNACPFTNLPRRYWQFVLIYQAIAPETLWAHVTKQAMHQLVQGLHRLALPVTGKGVFKDEFVTAGGVDAACLNLKTLEAKPCPGVYIGGELLNVDAMTGGFNFQHCWASAHAIACAIHTKTLPASRNTWG